jgi:hypothetical protein
MAEKDAALCAGISVTLRMASISRPSIRIGEEVPLRSISFTVNRPPSMRSTATSTSRLSVPATATAHGVDVALRDAALGDVSPDCRGLDAFHGHIGMFFAKEGRL